MTAILYIHSCHAWKKMSTPIGDNAFPHELELTVRAELTLAETNLPEEVDGITMHNPDGLEIALL